MPENTGAGSGKGNVMDGIVQFLKCLAGTSLGGLVERIKEKLAEVDPDYDIPEDISDIVVPPRVDNSLPTGEPSHEKLVDAIVEFIKDNRPKPEPKL